MHAKIKKVGAATVLELKGNIDFETAKPFREQCSLLLKKSEATPKLIFNMKGLKFVGSSGLSSFIQTLKDLNHLKTKPRFCGVGSEFKKMFRIYSPDENFEIYTSEEEAADSFTTN
jgi:anti-anti-sigma factor